MLLNVLLERFHNSSCLLIGESGLYQAVGTYRVDGLLVRAMYVHQLPSQVGIRGERTSGAFQQLPLSFSNGRFWWVVLPRFLPCGVQSSVRICGGDQVRNEVLERYAMRCYLDGLRDPWVFRWRSKRARRLARDERTSGSRSPILTRSNSLSNDMVGFLSKE